MEKLLQLNEFFVEGGHQEISHVLLNLIQPSNETEEKEKGYFFAICEINHGNSEQLTELQRIVGEIENDYYETSDTSEKNALEIVLEKINQKNLALFSMNLSLHCIVGAIKSNEIVFSYCGKPTMLLFYHTKENAFKKMDLTENADEENVAGSKTLFSQIIQGKVSPGDFFFVGTKKIIEYFNHDRLQKIITTRSPEQSTEHIRRVLSELKNGISFGGLIIHLRGKNSVENIVEKRTRVIPENKETMNSLFLTEQNTANTLSPSLFGDLVAKIKSSTTKFKNQRLEKLSLAKGQEDTNTTQVNSTHLKHRFAEKINKENTLKILSLIGKYLWAACKNLGQFLWWVLLMLTAMLAAFGKLLKALFFYLINYKNQRRQIKEHWSQAWYSYRQNFKHLPLSTKILGLSSIIVLLVFVGSIVYLQHAKETQKQNLAYTQTFTSLRNKLEEANSFLLYDLTSAENIKNEIKQTLSTFVCRPNDEANCREITDDFDTLQKTLQKFVANPKITMLINWNVFGFGGITKFVKIDGKMLGINSATSTIYTYNLLTKDGAATLKLPNEDRISLVASLRDEKTGLLLTDAKELYRYDSAENSFTKITLTFQNEETNIKNILPYNSRIYTLDVLNNQIYRHDAIATGYSVGKDWIKTQNIDIKTANSFAIDGDLFLTKGNGEILKFTNGEIQPFAISGLEPILASAAKIWTYSEDNYIYILDPLEKRLVVLNKDGSVKNQYTSDQFEKPSDMIIEEKNKTAYVLDTGRVFQIELK